MMSVFDEYMKEQIHLESLHRGPGIVIKFQKARKQLGNVVRGQRILTEVKKFSPQN